MPATFGVTDTYGQTIPSGGYAQTVEQAEDVEVATIKDETGQIKVAQAKPRKVTTVSIKLKGVASLASVVNGDMSNGSLSVTGAKYSQTNDDFSTSEINLTQYS